MTAQEIAEMYFAVFLVGAGALALFIGSRLLQSMADQQRTDRQARFDEANRIQQPVIRARTIAKLCAEYGDRSGAALWAAHANQLETEGHR